MQRSDYVSLEVRREVGIFKEYQEHSTFKEGLCLVKKNDKYGYIDYYGIEVIPCIYNKANDFSEGLALVETDEKMFIDIDGMVVLNDSLKKYTEISNFHWGLACVKRDDKYGYIDISGKEIIPCIYDEAYNIKEGLGRVKKGCFYGFIKKTGEEVIPCDRYTEAEDFSCGRALVFDPFHYGFIDQNGMEIIPCSYDDASSFSEDRAVILTERKSRYGFTDKNGRESNDIYDYCRDFHEGLAGVYKDKKAGYINKEGKRIVPFVYDEVYDFHEGLARVTKGKKNGYINQKGQVVVPIIYDDASDFYKGTVKVKLNEREFYINKYNEEVLEEEYLYKNEISDSICIQSMSEIPRDVKKILQVQEFISIYELDDRIIIVRDHDHKAYLKKIQSVETIINEDKVESICKYIERQVK